MEEWRTARVDRCTVRQVQPLAPSPFQSVIPEPTTREVTMATELPPDDARQSTHDGILKRVFIPSFILIGLVAIGFLLFY
jgi:hypothetical protein